MAGEDVVAVEAVVVRPGVEEQVGVSWSERSVATRDEQLLVESPNDP